MALIKKFRIKNFKDKRILLKLEKISISIKANAQESGSLFGSVGNLDILEALHAEGAEFVTKSSIILPDGPIKEVGEFAVNVELHPEIVKSINVEVLPA